MKSQDDTSRSGAPPRNPLTDLRLTLENVRCIWDQGEHNAFTDLCEFSGRYWLVFRQATNHVSDDGVLVILSSDDGGTWKAVAQLSLDGVDLRDPKIVPTPRGQLLMTCAGVLYRQDGHPHQSFLWFSDDGQRWTAPQSVGRLHDWIWRTRFFGDDGYGVAYHAAEQSTTLYQFSNGVYRPWVDPLFAKETHGLGYPNEHDLFSVGEGGMGCLLRRDADTATAQLGVAGAPYRDWTWRDLGVRIGGPVVSRIALASGDTALLSAVRLYDPVRTALCRLDVEAGRLTEILSLPSGGDTSYAGLLQCGERILCSYYSSHEHKTAIYLARLTLV